MTKLDLCTAALQELGVLDPEDTASDADMNTASEAFDDLYDAWNAQRQAVYADVFARFTLTASLSPQTIGPSGVLVVTQRPVSIESASQILTSGTLDVSRPIDTRRDADWWARQQVKGLETGYPTDLYYQPAWPNGNAFFHPVPDSAVVVELQTRLLLAALTLNDTFTMPPGYRRAVKLSLAEFCARPFARQVTPDLKTDAATAREVVFKNNRTIPNIATADYGMPRSGSSGRQRTYNWLDRSL